MKSNIFGLFILSFYTLGIVNRHVTVAVFETIIQGDPKKSKPIFGRHFGILPEGNFKFSGNITKL